MSEVTAQCAHVYMFDKRCENRAEPGRTLCDFHPIADEPDALQRSHAALLEALKEKEELLDAARELLEVATLRGDTLLAHPAEDARLWTGRMQEAWDELERVLDAREDQD